MWDIGGSGNDAFDSTFMLSEEVGMGFWLFAFLCLAFARPHYQTFLIIGFIGAFIFDLVLPAIWRSRFPPHDGLESVGRLMWGGPWVAANGLLACIWAGVLAMICKRKPWRSVSVLAVFLVVGTFSLAGR